MRAVIVGAGIGGLVAALRLHRVGIACTVYEQSESVRPLGVGLNLLPHAVAELAEIGGCSPPSTRSPCGPPSWSTATGSARRSCGGPAVWVPAWPSRSSRSTAAAC